MDYKFQKNIKNFKSFKISNHELTALIVFLINLKEEDWIYESDEIRFMYSDILSHDDILPSTEVSENLRLLFENKNLKNIASHMRLKNNVIGVTLNHKHYTILNDLETIKYFFENHKVFLSKYFKSEDNIIYKLK